MIDKVNAFVLTIPGKENYDVSAGFGWLEPNHHTQPSVFHSTSHKTAYVFIDGILYKLENVKDPNNITTFLLESFFILTKPSTGTHKSKKELVKEIKTRDHVAAIRTYLAEMKEVQEKATANFTDEEKNEIAIIEQAQIDKDNGIKAKNAAYWNSPEGKAVLAKGNKNSDNKMTVKNTGKKEVVLYADKGTIRISGGASQTFTCGDKIYHCSQGAGGTWNVKGAIVADGSKNCGKTVVVNND